MQGVTELSLRVDQRDPTLIELDAYNKLLKLSDHILSVCKPKDKNANAHHIPKRHAGIGRMMVEEVVAIGADILEANEIYVGNNLDADSHISHLRKRIELQDDAIWRTYRIEHIFRVLHFDYGFAESTAKYMMDMLCETRGLLVKWKDSTSKMSKQLQKRSV